MHHRRRLGSAARGICDAHVRKFDDGRGALDDFAERGVLAVEPRGAFAREPDEPLAARGVGIVVAGHRDHAEVVRQTRRLERNRVAGSAFALAGRIAALNDERPAFAIKRHDAVQDRAVVEARGGEVAEVPGGAGRLVGTQRDDDLAAIGLEHDVALGIAAESAERDLGGLPGLRRLAGGVEGGFEHCFAPADDAGVRRDAVGPHRARGADRRAIAHRHDDPRRADRLPADDRLQPRGALEGIDRRQRFAEKDLAGSDRSGLAEHVAGVIEQDQMKRCASKIREVASGDERLGDRRVAAGDRERGRRGGARRRCCDGADRGHQQGRERKDPKSSHRHIFAGMRSGWSGTQGQGGDPSTIRRWLRSSSPRQAVWATSSSNSRRRGRWRRRRDARSRSAIGGPIRTRFAGRSWSLGDGRCPSRPTRTGDSPWRDSIVRRISSASSASPRRRRAATTDAAATRVLR